MPSEKDRARPQATCTKIWQSSAMQFSSFASRQTDKQTDILITIPHTPPVGKVIITAYPNMVLKVEQ